MEPVKTTKSFKSGARDKPKHSSTGVSLNAKKGGAGGKGTWGVAEDDTKFNDMENALDERDPNYDPGEDDKEVMLAKVWLPTKETSTKFTNSLQDLNMFKKGVKSAAEEYLVATDMDEFVRCIKELNMPIYHQDIAAILIKPSLDKGDEDRQKTSQMLKALYKQGMLTGKQVAQGFRKLFNSLDELVLDVPQSRINLLEFLGHANAAGYIDTEEAANIEKEMIALEDANAVKQAKDTISNRVKEYYLNQVSDEFVLFAKEIEPAFHFEIVKQLVMLSMDRAQRDRELASASLGTLASNPISTASFCKAFEIMLCRVEDIVLDVPDTLRLLSCFIARAIVDEVLPPVFLMRLDLSEADMGYLVVKRAQEMVERPRAAEELASVWE